MSTYICCIYIYISLINRSGLFQRCSNREHTHTFARSCSIHKYTYYIYYIISLEYCSSMCTMRSQNDSSRTLIDSLVRALHLEMNGYMRPWRIMVELGACQPDCLPTCPPPYHQPAKAWEWTIIKQQLRLIISIILCYDYCAHVCVMVEIIAPHLRIHFSWFNYIVRYTMYFLCVCTCLRYQSFPRTLVDLIFRGNKSVTFHVRCS